MNSEQFIDYVLDFYGKGGIYDMGVTRKQVTSACLIRLTDPRFIDTPWGADTVDREIIRDILLAQSA